MFSCTGQTRGKDGQDAGSEVSVVAAAGSDYTCDVTSELSSSDIIQVTGVLMMMMTGE